MNPERYAEIKKLFLAATELDESARDQFLREHCGSDSLLQQEVQSLLDNHSAQTILPDDSIGNQANIETRNITAQTTRTGADRSKIHHPRIPKLGHKGQLALGAAIVGALLVFFGVWQRNEVHESIRDNLHDRMIALLEGHVESFEHWANYQRNMVEYWAADSTFKEHVQALVDLDQNGSAEGYSHRLRAAPQQHGIRKELRSAGGTHAQYVVLDMQQRVIAEGPEKGTGLGKLVSTSASSKLATVFRGQTLMFADDVRDIIHPEYPVETEIVDVFVASPIRDENGNVFAIVTMFNVDTAVMENSIRSTSNITNTSETYAFNEKGLMLSESRFNDDLQRVGIIESKQPLKSSLRVMLRDPGGDLTAGFKPTKTLASRPLTHMARHATAGEDGAELDGYRNYLGRTVVGVWKWLPEYGFGFAMEMSMEEAYLPLDYVKRQLQLSFAMLTAALIGILLSALWISRLRRNIDTNRQLGQYTLEKLIGEGGMGKVYLARHSFLKRPCAVKVLKPDQSNPRSLAWFEREVQSASLLTHPNTIQIYDYGSTPEGNFFYAMEYLHGIDLEQLVIQSGPVPWSRVVYILRQICCSLREAHESGVVHRDIKPQNIMICQLGGEADHVKVLDFGLVKKINPDETTQTRTGSVAGTPLYMAPERWRDSTINDPRSDIYSIGAVAYRLLSARDIFSAATPVALAEQIISGDVTPLSRLETPDLPPALEKLIMSCLARDLASRPDSVSQILEEFRMLPDENPWNQSDAREWWRQWEHNS